MCGVCVCIVCASMMRDNVLLAIGSRNGRCSHLVSERIKEKVAFKTHTYINANSKYHYIMGTQAKNNSTFDTWLLE